MTPCLAFLDVSSWQNQELKRVLQSNLRVRSPQQFVASADAKIRILNSCVFDFHAGVGRKLEHSATSQGVFKTGCGSTESAVKIIVNLGIDNGIGVKVVQVLAAVLRAVTVKTFSLQLQTEFGAVVPVNKINEPKPHVPEDVIGSIPLLIESTERRWPDV